MFCSWTQLNTILFLNSDSDSDSDSMYSDAIVSQVLDELGLNLSDELSSKKTLVCLTDLFTMYIVSLMYYINGIYLRFLL